MNLHIVAVRANYLHTKNKLNDKERKKESQRRKNKQYLYNCKIITRQLLASAFNTRT